MKTKLTKTIIDGTQMSCIEISAKGVNDSYVKNHDAMISHQLIMMGLETQLINKLMKYYTSYENKNVCKRLLKGVKNANQILKILFP